MRPLIFSLSFSSAFLPPWILASDDMPKPYQRSLQGLLVVWGSYSSDQILVGQPPAGRAINEAVETVEGMPLHVARIETERELVNVPAEMLGADMMESSVDAAFQNGPDAFDAIGRNVVADILACTNG